MATGVSSHFSEVFRYFLLQRKPVPLQMELSIFEFYLAMLDNLWRNLRPPRFATYGKGYLFVYFSLQVLDGVLASKDYGPVSRIKIEMVGLLGFIFAGGTDQNLHRKRIHSGCFHIDLFVFNFHVVLP